MTSVFRRVCKLLSALSEGEFLGCGANMRAGISEVLGDELTTLREADSTIEKREERRRDKRANWIWVTS